MDLNSFSSDDFDTKAWINDILKNATNQKESNYTMSLVMKLQLYVQQVNSALEDTSQQVLASLPKILRDTKNLQQEAFTLKEKMGIVKTELEKIERDTENSIDSIEQLDSMKSKLILAKQGLHESDNWMILVNDLEEVFDSKNIENISMKILGMQHSLKLLENVADYEDRKLQLEELKNRLEAIASPAIVQAFNTSNADQAHMYMKTFKSIGRLSHLIKYYQKCQKDILLKKWRSQLEIEQDESTTQLIHNYYNFLLSNWHTQYRWFNQVFPNDAPAGVLIDIYADVLSSLDPSMNECIEATLKQTVDKMTLLSEIKQSAKEFSESLKKLSNQNDDNLAARKFSNLLQVIYQHLVPYMSKYAAYEQAYLMKQLSSLNCMKEELPETIQSLGLSIPFVFDIAREAKKRCQELTENCGYCGLLIAFRAFFVGYADFFRVALRQVDRSKRHKEDWNMLQLCFSLLQSTGEVLLELQHLEKDLTNSVLVLNQTETNLEYKNLLLSLSERKEVESLIKCVTEGSKLSLLDHVTSEFNRLCADIHHTLYQVVFAPISTHLDVVEAQETWSQFASSLLHTNSDLPDYSFTPQEYITQIGQYLMTLPQHLEPFLFTENPSLSSALRAANQEYNEASDRDGALAHVFLSIIARGTCQGYCDRILSICELSQPASRQLAHDIDYLNNILEEVGIPLTENLQQLLHLLKLPTDQYLTQSNNYSARLVAAVRQIRNIKSST